MARDIEVNNKQHSAQHLQTRIQRMHKMEEAIAAIASATTTGTDGNAKGRI
jgi:hypothetical protein